MTIFALLIKVTIFKKTTTKTEKSNGSKLQQGILLSKLKYN